MTKLMQWIFVLNLFAAIYTVLIFNQLESKFVDKWMFEIQISPIVLIALFGVSKILQNIFNSKQ